MADAEAKQEVVHEWPPLESDPETFAKLAEFLGLEVRRTRMEPLHGPAKIAWQRRSTHTWPCPPLLAITCTPCLQPTRVVPPSSHPQSPI